MSESDTELKKYFVNAIKKLINGAIALDPAAKYRLAELEGSRLIINCTKPKFDLCFQPTHSEINVLNKHEFSDQSQSSNAQVTLTGNLIDFIKLTQNENYSLNDTGVTVSGKVQLLASYQAFFNNLELDWEAKLVEIFGNSAGHSLAELFRASGSWSVQQKNQFEKQLPDLLTTELSVMPSEHEINSQLQDIDSVRAHYDRLEARTNRVEKLIKDKNIKG